MAKKHETLTSQFGPAPHLFALPGKVWGTAIDADYHERTLDRMLDIPEFLRSKRGRLTREQVAALNSASIAWAPFRDYSQPAEPKPDPKLYVGNPDKQVAVSAKGIEGVTRYDSMEAFKAAHDFATFPVARTVEFESEIVISCNAKPWAKPKERVAKAPRQARDFSQPDAPGKAVKRDSVVGRTLAMLLTGTHTFETIVANTKVRSGDPAAEVKHHMRFVLFRNHGVGHKEVGGKLVAVLPSGFDKTSIFKEK